MEDDAIESMDIKSTLESFGYEVPYTASRGEEAVEKAKKEIPDLILMDIVLKGNIDGIEAANEIKELDIPLIFLTAHSEDATVQKAKLTGPYGYLIKPYDPSELKYAIELALYKNQMEKKLKESEKRYKSIVETANEGIWGADADFNITYVNPKIAEMLGYSTEEMLGKHVTFFMFEEDFPDREKHVEKRIKGHPETYERRFRHKNGSEVSTIVSVTALMDDKGDFAGTFSMFTDITDRKKMEKELLSSQKQLKDIIDGSPILQFVIDKNHHVIYWNQAIADYSGIPPEDIIGTDEHWRAFYNEKRPCLADIMVDGDLETVDKWYSGKYKESKHLKGACSVEDFFPSMGENGKWLHFTAATIKNSEGKIIGALETLEDISDRKQAENELENSEKRLKMALEGANAAYFYWHVLSGEADLSPEFYSMYGYEPGEFPATWDAIKNLIHPDDREKTILNIEKQVKDRSEKLEIEYRALCKDGTIKWILGLGRLDEYGENGSIGITGINLDITDRKIAEISVNEQYHFLQHLIDTIPYPLFYKNTEYMYMGCNKAFEDFMGLPIKEIIGKTVFDVSPKDLADKYHEKDEELFKNQGSQSYELPVQYADGTRHTMLFKKTTFDDEEGRIAGLIGVMVDITDRIRAEEALKASESFLNDIINQSPHPMWISDEHGTLIRINQACLDMLNISEEEVLGKYNLFDDNIVEEQGFMPLVNKVFEKGQNVNFELVYDTSQLENLKLENFSKIFLDVSIFPVKDAGGNVKNAVIQHINITDRKKAEFDLINSEAEYKAIFENIKSAVAVYNAIENGGDFVFKDFNRSAEQIEAIEREDVIGKRVTEVFPSVIEFGLFEVFQRVWKTGKPERHPISSYEDERIKGWRENYVYKLPSGDIVAVYDDLTEIKQYEEELEQNQVRLKSLVRILQYRAESVQDLLDYALKEAITLTESKIGYIYHYYGDKKEFVLNTWSKGVMDECSITEQPSVYELDKTGIWGEAVRQRKPIILNDFQAEHPLKKGYPEGHAPLYKFMTLPIFSGDKIVAVVGVANKDSNYTETDVLQLELLMDGVWKIVDTKTAEDALEKSETRYRAIFENTGTAMAISEADMTLSLVNDEFADLTGYSKGEIENKMTWVHFFVEEELPRMKEYHRIRRTDPNAAPRTYESVLIDREGNRKDVYMSVSMLPETKKSLVSVLDITEKKQSRSKLRRELKINQSLAKIYKPLISPLTTVQDISISILRESLSLSGSEHGFVATIDPKNNDLVNQTLTRMMPQCEVYDDGKIPEEIRFPIGADGRYSGLWGHCLNTKESFYDNEARNHPSAMGAPEGHVGIERFLAVPVLIDEELVGEIALANPPDKDYNQEDLKAVERIAEFFALAIQRKGYEEQISKSLNEKDLLLREIHHRVKNNMQIISSILNLQSYNVKDSDLLDILKQNQNRIKSMAMIHEKLYQSHNLVQIDFGDYLRSLTASIFYTYSVHAEGIDIDLDLDKNIMLNIETSIPCGLIFSELLTNSIKHAFPMEKGEIKVKFKSFDDNLMLSVSDNGVGLDEELDFRKTDSLGLQLVNNLVNQIDGNIELDRSHGTKFTIKFQELVYKDRM